MAASWPSSKKTFTQIVDGTTYIEGVNVNTVYDETEALQTFIGAPGTTQAKNAALNHLFRNLFNQLPKVTWTDADTISIAACQVAMFSGNDYVIKRKTAATSILLSADLDTGSEAADTWYDVFLIGDGANTEYTAQFVLQGNTPSGATYYKKIFSVRNDGSSNIKEFYHRGNQVTYGTRQAALTGGSAGAWTDIDLSNYVPAIAEHVRIAALDDGGNHYCEFRVNGSSGGPCCRVMFNTAGADLGGHETEVPTDGNQVIEYQLSGANSVDVYVHGYYLTELT